MVDPFSIFVLGFGDCSLIIFPVDEYSTLKSFKIFFASFLDGLGDCMKIVLDEGSMRMMGEKAHKALNDYWSWIEAYMEGEQDE